MTNSLNPKLNRRKLLQAAAVTGTAAALPMANAEAATPKKGGKITVGSPEGSTTDTLQPGQLDNGFTSGVSYAVNGYLTEVGVDGSLQPSLAEAFEGSNGAKTWMFKIRKGAEWHDGRKVTSADIVASINTHRGDDSTSAAKPLFNSVTEVKADGPGTVVVTLESGNADFPFLMTEYNVPMVPEKDGEVDWKPGIGCGAYKLDNFEAGVSVEMTRNPNYWTDDKGFFDELQTISLVDPNARTAALISGDVDVIDRVDLKTASLLGRKPGVNIHSATGTQHYTYPMLTSIAPYDDINVRLALKYAVNREELVEKILFGYGEVGNDHPIGSGQRYFNKDLEQRTYDPDKAKFYLNKAGLSSLSVDLSAADAAYGGAVDAAVLYQNSAAAAGIDINVVREPNDGYWSDVWMNKAFCACYWGGRPVEDMMFSTAYQTGVAWNDSHWSNERFDALLVEARAELDEAKRRDMYYEMQAIVNQDGGVIVPMFASYVFAMNDSIGTTGEFSAVWALDGQHWSTRWWKK